MRLVDLSHPVSMHMPGWQGPGLRMWYWANRTPNGIAVQVVETQMHVSTHIDAPLHGIPGGGDMASVPLDQLYGPAAIADVSELGEWGIITPEVVMKKVEVRPRDILILHTGWHKYYTGMPEENPDKYFCFHPGPDPSFADWAVEMKLRWVGLDCGAGDHPMNSSMRDRRPELVKVFEERFGVKVAERFPKESILCMHKKGFRHGVLHAENLGGDLATILNRRCTVGAFPWKLVDGEASICRIIAFLED